MKALVGAAIMLLCIGANMGFYRWGYDRGYKAGAEECYRNLREQLILKTEEARQKAEERHLPPEA